MMDAERNTQPRAGRIDTDRRSRDAPFIADTERWLERAVIGLNLCPFARAPLAQGRLRITVSHAPDADTLYADLCRELRVVAGLDARDCETSLLIHPQVLTDFRDYNAFLDRADAALQALDLEGVWQVASFHPRYRFAGSAADAIDHCSNRSPWPLLHLLREASVTRAVDAMADPDAIYRANIATLRRLGHAGWDALWSDDT